ncbi:uncharacterized protein LOC128745106 [Sabethes cyaneus]|uniref:uncharacterized protein LOC128745106 n=1 Tax=Sabethes cyaneus TaxID=53552 RepID=UPI00237EB964|nr:uncharacterized protein LOC128745106 [Sabethes cyaneus]
MSRDEFEELLYYVVELKDKLNAKLDEQCAKINHQGSIINQQGQIVDELCWQLRELSEKTRELRAENRRLTERLDRFCPRCTGCRCESSTYENHLAERYNELSMEVECGGKKQACSSATTVISDCSDKEVKSIEDQLQEPNKVDGYSQVTKKRDTNTLKKKWLFGGKGEATNGNPTKSLPVQARSNTVWYLDDVSIYEPIELSAKPSTRAQLEKISAEVMSSSSCAPKPAPRRLYAAHAVDNLAEYFGEQTTDQEQTNSISSDDAGVLLRPTRMKQFSSESQRGSSKVACSQISDLEQSYLPTEQSIAAENFVRFTINSRPATTAVATGAAESGNVPDNRRHAIRSYM